MTEESLICSFCGKSRKDVTKMIVGAKKTSICNECVKLCVEILEEDIVKARKEQLYAGDKEILNPNGLRNDKEFVNHKILDCIGDLYTSGYRMIASIKCSQGGHYLTNKLLKKVFSNKENFSIVEIKEKNLPHSLINKTLLRSIA